MVKPTHTGPLVGCPKWAIDHPVCHPASSSIKKASTQPSKQSSDKPRGPQQNLIEWRGTCCDGTHFWGHGQGFDDGRGCKIYKCDNSKCRKLLPYLPHEAQEKLRSPMHCVYCLAQTLMANGKMSKEDAKEEAQAIFATAAELK